MSISEINDSHCNDILRLQNEAYFAFEPESLATLQQKWHLSPDTCFVYIQEHRPVAYLLAHGWSGDLLPKLDQSIEGDKGGDYLFLHDLVVSKQCGGMGIGAAMVGHLLEVAVQKGFQQVKLVAVQGSSSFWSRMGFIPDTGVSVSAEYGDNAIAMVRDIP